MKILVVDDGQLAINSLIRILCRVAPDCDYISAMTTEDALSWMRQGPMDAAFLNLEMPGMNGLALTRMIQKLQPRCNIIVVTEHPEYALEALQIFVSGFLLKPANEADVRNVLEHLRYPPENAPVGIKIQCFGNFEIFVGGRALAFKRSKSKELLAYLVDRNGATCTNGEKNVPAFESKPVELYGGRYHFTALMDDGEVISWGDNTHGQASVPASFNDKEIVTVYAGFYQNYAVTVDGDVETWGLKGYVCGTDDLGRDVFNRIINGGKVTMTVGAISVIIQLIIGIILGGLAGYFGGWVDNIIMRISEIVGGLPFLPFAMILSAIIGTRITPEQRMYLIMVVLGVLSWPGICHLIRAQIFSQREQEYVTAAKALGVREKSIIFHHIIPNVMSLILVNATLSFATCMLTESSLSYMGFGIAPPTPTWGNMLTGANNSIVIQQYWWRWVFPAAIFGICTICINLVGDALRDAVDPKSAER